MLMLICTRQYQPINYQGIKADTHCVLIIFGNFVMV